MAHAGLFLDQDQFNCSICLDVLKDPVTIPCGHSYCNCCIKGYWDQNEYIGVFGCPQCRQTFNPRPVLGRNTMLTDVVEKFKKTGLVVAALDECYAGPGDVECDVCTGRRKVAVKSCLVCLASYCETHLQPHYESSAFKKHKLVEALKQLQENVCSHHGKLLEVYCRTDKQCICYLCLTDEHKGHDTVLAEAEITERKNQLSDMQKILQQRIQEREKGLQELRLAMGSLTRSAQAAADDSEHLLTELIRSVELRRFEVRELIRAQERAALGGAEGLAERLERELAELRRREGELERLRHEEEHVRLIQGSEALCMPPACRDLSSFTTDPSATFGVVMRAVSDFKGLMEEVCAGGFVGIYEQVKAVTIVEQPKPDTKKEESPDLTTTPGAMATPLSTPLLLHPPLFSQSTGQLNPFSATGLTIPTFTGFAFSSLGPKFSGPRQRQRRHPPRRK